MLYHIYIHIQNISEWSHIPHHFVYVCVYIYIYEETETCTHITKVQIEKYKYIIGPIFNQICPKSVSIGVCFLYISVQCSQIGTAAVE